jgi:hypothetical protein
MCSGGGATKPSFTWLLGEGAKVRGGCPGSSVHQREAVPVRKERGRPLSKNRIKDRVPNIKIKEKENKEWLQ